MACHLLACKRVNLVQIVFNCDVSHVQVRRGQTGGRAANAWDDRPGSGRLAMFRPVAPLWLMMLVNVVPCCIFFIFCHLHPNISIKLMELISINFYSLYHEVSLILRIVQGIRSWNIGRQQSQGHLATEMDEKSAKLPSTKDLHFKEYKDCTTLIALANYTNKPWSTS